MIDSTPPNLAGASRTDVAAILENLSPFDALRHEDEQGEHWFARELQSVAGYAQWRQFEDAIQRAKVAIANTQEESSVHDHIADVRKVTEGGRWGTQEVNDYQLTRYGAYMVFMNGDPRKPEIASAQSYFAIKAREAEVQQLQAKVAIEAELVKIKPKAQLQTRFEDGRTGYTVADTGAMFGKKPMEFHALVRAWGITYRTPSGRLCASLLWVRKGWMKLRAGSIPVFTPTGIEEIGRLMNRRGIA